MIELGGHLGGVSSAWRLQHRGPSIDAPWVGAADSGPLRPGSQLMQQPLVPGLGEGGHITIGVPVT